MNSATLEGRGSCSGESTSRRVPFIAALVVIGTVVLHLAYLYSPVALSLTGDEAYYWEWSRRLDWSYLSKPPMIALLIRGSCELLGNTMPAVRLPAVLLGAGSAWLLFVLARRLFLSDRVALTALLLVCCVPLMIAGSTLMTIDSPLFFFLALATLCAHLAIFENRRWAWLACAGALLAGMMTKYSAAIWPIGLFAYLALTPSQRKHLRSPWLYLLLLVLLIGLLPGLIWNTHHGWVTLRHLQEDVGDTGEVRNHLQDILEFIGGQIALISPTILAMVIGGIGLAFRATTQDPDRDRLRFLVLLAAPLWILPGIVSFWNKTQGNWTAPALFPMTILAGHFLASRMADPRQWRIWRPVAIVTSITALLVIIVAHHGQWVYVATDFANRHFSTHLRASRFDVARRGRGWDALGRALNDRLSHLPANTLVMSTDYQTTSLFSFYTTGQPLTYRVGAYTSTDPRLTQFEMWPDRRLDQPQLLGRDALIIAPRPELPLKTSFERVDDPESLPILIAGQEIRTLYLIHATGFKGMTAKWQQVPPLQASAR